MKLTREVRCWSDGADTDRTARNSWAGAPGGGSCAAFWTLRAVVEGAVDPSTGYVCDIRVIDEWLYGTIASAIRERIRTSERCPSMAACLVAVGRIPLRGLPESIRLHAIEWSISPYTRYTVLTRHPNSVLLTRAFEFSASHRLLCEGFSDEQNRRVFGKCANPHGHGHNYVFDVTLRGTPSAATGLLCPMPEIDRIVHERIVDPFDHKNLNLECAEFATLNPSVENIARVIFGRLRNAFDGVELTSVRVWETPKTSAECTAEDVRDAPLEANRCPTP